MEKRGLPGRVFGQAFFFRRDEIMANLLKNFKGQSVVMEYAMTFALVLAVITAMTVYFKRVVQSRYVGARDFVGREIKAVYDSGDYSLAGDFALEYEPYYTQRAIVKDVHGTVIERERGGNAYSGPTQQKEFDHYTTTMQIISNQLAPKYAD